MSRYSLNRQIPAAIIRSHSHVSSWKSPALIALIYFLVFALTFVQANYLSLYLLPVSVIIMAGFQHHLITLMHEGAHNLIHPDRKMNDRISQAFCAFPLAMMLKDYRYFHLMHHKHSGDPELDPEIAFYKETQIGYGVDENKFLKNLFNDLTGYATVRSLKYLRDFNLQCVREGKIRDIKPWDIKWGIVGVVSILSIALSLNITVMFLSIWVLSFLLVLPLLIRWHAVGEHTGENPTEEQNKTLTHEFNFIANFFLYPIRSGYHLEHHLFAQIPWYHVNSFRREIQKNEIYANEARKLTVDGYWFGKKTVKSTVLAN